MPERMYFDKELTDYVWLPYQCKRLGLDYARSVNSTRSMTQVLYLGDGTLRSTYCSRLYPFLNDLNIDGDCFFDKQTYWEKYQRSDKSFRYTANAGPVNSNAITNNDNVNGANSNTSSVSPSRRQGERHVQFSVRYVDDRPGDTIGRMAKIKPTADSLPVSHILTNLGMFYTRQSRDHFVANIFRHMDNLYNYFGRKARYTWVTTYSISPSVWCFNGQNRAVLSLQNGWAMEALEEWKRKHRGVKLNIVQAFETVDSRPETTGDGR